MPELDARPDNVLGKGILPPEREAALVEQGAVFAIVLASGTVLWGCCSFCSSANRIMRDAYITKHGIRAPLPLPTIAAG